MTIHQSSWCGFYTDPKSHFQNLKLQLKMSAVGGVARAGRRWWVGDGSVCWARRASLGLPVPSPRPPGAPALATPAPCSSARWSCPSCLQSFLHSLRLVCRPFPGPAHPALLGSPRLSAVPPPCQSHCCAQTQENLGAWSGADVGIPRLLGGELRTSRGFLAWLWWGWGSGALPFSEKQERPGVFLPEPGALLGLA